MDIIGSLPQNSENKVYTNPFIRFCTSSYIKYRTVCRAKSTADMMYKLKIIEEELDESIDWLDIVQERNNGIKTDLEQKKETNCF